MKQIRRMGLFLILVLVLLFVYHRVCLQIEAHLLTTPIGKTVMVKGHRMVVHQVGQGQKTLVFLAGAGTVSPILDSQSLSKELSKDYRFIIIERFGYGFSDVVSGQRTPQLIMEEAREALKLASVDGPFILLPHSMSGISALAWAQAYPDEVEAIIGLDMGLPASYKDVTIHLPLLRLAQGARQLGLARLVPSQMLAPVLSSGNLREKEKELYLALTQAKGLNETVLSEAASIKAGAVAVSQEPLPKLPFLLVVSNGQGTGFKKAEWRAYQEEFAKQVDGKMVYLEASHYLYHEEASQVNQVIKDFLSELPDH